MVKALTYILENNSTVQGLVGLRSGGSDYKIFPVVVFDTEKIPYVVVTLIAKESQGKNCDHQSTATIVSYAESYDDVTDLNEACKAALLNENSGTVNGLSFGFVNFQNESDGYSKDHNAYFKILTVIGNSDQ